MLLSVLVLTLCCCVITTALMRLWLKRRLILDLPNERSNHRTPTPRGAGLAVIVSVSALCAAGILLVPFPYGDQVLLVLAASIALATVSFFDDIGSLPIHERLITHIIAVAVGVIALPGPVFAGLLPPWLDMAVAGLLWLWCLNAVNFMDGIDGITGVETGAIAVGVIVLALLDVPMPEGMNLLAATLAGGALGFLVWNWHPAKVFLGDAGSVALGYLIGYALLSLAASGAWAAALILPAYYAGDATFTITKRILSGKKPWEAHSEHAYQCAVRAGWTHDGVVWRIVGVNAVLVLLAFSVTLHVIPDWLGVLAAYGLVALLMRVFYSPRG